MKLLKIRNDGISMSSKHMLIESTYLKASNLKIKTDKYERIKILTNKMVDHNNGAKRLDFFEIQEVIADIGTWLDRSEH